MLKSKHRIEACAVSARDLATVVVVIPAQNEEAALSLVLQDLPNVARVIVVDNASTDQTPFVAAGWGATVVSEPRRGYGAACLAGLQEIARAIDAQEMASPRVVAFLDGDYSDHPELLPLLVEPIFAGYADFVLGTRLFSKRERGAMPPHCVLGNRLACFLMRWIWDAPYSDLGPFRAIRYDALQSLQMIDRGYGWTIEMQIKAVLAGLRIVEAPVPYRRRVGASKISGTWSGSVKAGAKILLTIGRYWAMCRRRRGSTAG